MLPSLTCLCGIYWWVFVDDDVITFFFFTIFSVDKGKKNGCVFRKCDAFL